MSENPYEDTCREDTIALTGVENVHFPDIRNWIREHLEFAAKKKVIASETEENLLLADVIYVLKLLVKYGYYDDIHDVESVLRPLLKLLNGYTDLPFVTSTTVPGKELLLISVYCMLTLVSIWHNFAGKWTGETRYKETKENKPIFLIKSRYHKVM